MPSFPEKEFQSSVVVPFMPSFCTFPEVISFISELDNKLTPSEMLPGSNEETEKKRE